MRTVLIDSNFLLRFLLNDIPSQAEETTRYLERAERREIKILVPQIVIFEIAFVLMKVYKLKKVEVIKLIKTLVSNPYLEVPERRIILEGLNLYAEKNVDFIDCYLFCLAKDKKAEVLSFDKDLKKLSRRS